MKKLGGYLFFFGAGSFVLSMLGLQFIVLAWVDLWGPKIGLAIRVGLVVVGGLLWLVGRSQEQANQAQVARTI